MSVADDHEAEFFGALGAGDPEAVRLFASREHIIDGPCWCGPVEDGGVLKHNLVTTP